MDFLRLLEGLRTPVLDVFFSAITNLGDATLFTALAVILFWCVDRKKGLYILFMGCFGNLFNTFLKMLFCIPRPWVIDPDFTIVESARGAATGYSFPSGHTQNVVSTFGGLAYTTKKKWVRITGIAILLLVSFSRMYLGVHQPKDVIVSFICAAVMIFAFWPIFRDEEEQPRRVLWLLWVFVAASVALVLYVTLVPFPENAVVEFSMDGVKNAWMSLGLSAGLLVSVILDRKYVHFDHKGSLKFQVFKAVVGLALVLAVRVGLKSLLALITDGFWAEAVRYFVMALVAGWGWPCCFMGLRPRFDKEAPQS